MRIKEPIEFLEIINEGVKEIFKTKYVVTYLVGSNRLYKFEKGSNKLKAFPITGLIGECIKNNTIKDYKQSLQAMEYNQIVDIDRNEPVRCVPVFNDKLSKIIIASEFILKKQTIIMDSISHCNFSQFICYIYEEILVHSNLTSIIPDYGYAVKNPMIKDLK